MNLKLEEVVPWGRAMQEYVAMFALTSRDLEGRVLDCGGGPSSFTSEMAQQGRQAISCDPLYRFTGEEISRRIDDTYVRMTALNEANKEQFRWDYYKSPQELGQLRMQAMRQFLDDYAAGTEQGRYVIGELPNLPFTSQSFDLALCSHFLFTYSEQFSADFHLDAIVEMARVAREVRVFPLLTAFSGEPSPHLPAVMEHLRGRGYEAEVRKVGYEFQKGGDRMLCVAATASCV